MENALVTAQMAWREMVASANDYDFAAEIERANGTLIRKTIGAEAIERCVKKAVESTGGGAFYRKIRSRSCGAMPRPFSFIR